MGGGGFSEAAGDPLDAFVVELARAAAARRGSGDGLPRVCFLATASGDSEAYVEAFHAAFDTIAESSHLALFDRTVADVDGFLLEQDAIYVGGGNTANMLAVWRVHGVDRALRLAWERGIVMAGLSAGSLCWFESGTTDSFGQGLAILEGALGFIAGSNCPHYDSEPLRRPLYRQLVGDGRLPAGYAADDGAALVFRGTALAECVASRPAAACYRVTRDPGGEVHEVTLPMRLLGG
jgi:dipeptidase E